MTPNLIEIDLRGRFMAMACDIEWNLLLIMAWASPDPNKSKRLFQEMTMGNKIDCAISDLKKYKPVHYERNKESLEKLWEFHKIRNAMAHYRMTIFASKNPVLIEMKYMVNENDFEVRKSKDYTIDSLNDAIKGFQNLNLIFSALSEQLREEYLIARGIKIENNKVTLTPNWRPIETPEPPEVE